MPNRKERFRVDTWSCKISCRSIDKMSPIWFNRCIIKSFISVQTFNTTFGNLIFCWYISSYDRDIIIQNFTIIQIKLFIYDYFILSHTFHESIRLSLSFFNLKSKSYFIQFTLWRTKTSFNKPSFICLITINTLLVLSYELEWLTILQV